MFRLRCTFRSGQRRGILLGLLCILLVLMAGTIQVCHTHGANDASHPVCALCIAAHEVSLAAFPMVRPVVTTQARIVETAPWRNPGRFLVLDLYIRPPPAALAFA